MPAVTEFSPAGRMLPRQPKGIRLATICGTPRLGPRAESTPWVSEPNAVPDHERDDGGGERQPEHLHAEHADEDGRELHVRRHPGPEQLHRACRAVPPAGRTPPRPARPPAPSRHSGHQPDQTATGRPQRRGLSWCQPRSSPDLLGFGSPASPSTATSFHGQPQPVLAQPAGLGLGFWSLAGCWLFGPARAAASPSPCLITLMAVLWGCGQRRTCRRSESHAISCTQCHFMVNTTWLLVSQWT